MTVKIELLHDIETSWKALQDALDRLSDQQMTEPKDAHGWSVKDHIIHLTAWERMVVYFLQRKSRYVGLGVSQFIYTNGSTDDINEVIHQERKDLQLEEALKQFHEGHQHLLSIIKSLHDTDLHKNCQHFDPEVTEDKRSVLEVISSNTNAHYREHLPWIENLVDRGKQ